LTHVFNIPRVLKYATNEKGFAKQKLISTETVSLHENYENYLDFF